MQARQEAERLRRYTSRCRLRVRVGKQVEIAPTRHTFISRDSILDSERGAVVQVQLESGVLKVASEGDSGRHDWRAAEHLWLAEDRAGPTGNATG